MPLSLSFGFSSFGFFGSTGTTGGLSFGGGFLLSFCAEAVIEIPTTNAIVNNICFKFFILISSFPLFCQARRGKIKFAPSFVKAISMPQILSLLFSQKPTKNQTPLRLIRLCRFTFSAKFIRNREISHKINFLCLGNLAKSILNY